MSDKIVVSVVMPIYNEGKYIAACIDSLLKQDYPKNNMEWIFVDGNSSDNTLIIINQYQVNYPNLIRVYNNPYKIVPYAMNIGISESKGKYIIRLDAHADYAINYISKCVYYLEMNPEVDNVGGVAETKSKGFIGENIARMLSSKFGVGNSAFRTNGESGYVDTVPFGAFRREVFKKYGGFDERLVRNQDNEMNYRIRKNGGKIFLANDIHFSYYCRDSINGISKMAFNNGKWNVITMRLCPGSMGKRHFIPLLFVASIISLLLLGFIIPFFKYMLILVICLYMSLNIYFSIINGKTWKDRAILLLLFPVFHISYGIGSLCGVKDLLTKEYKPGNYHAPIV